MNFVCPNDILNSFAESRMVIIFKNAGGFGHQHWTETSCAFLKESIGWEAGL